MKTMDKETIKNGWRENVDMLCDDICYDRDQREDLRVCLRDLLMMSMA